MKNILIMSGTYYPDSMATIGITQRLAEELVKVGYNVSVYTIRYCGHRNPGYPKIYNGVEIFDTDDFMLHKSTMLKIKYGINKLSRRFIKRISKWGASEKRLDKFTRMLYKKPREQILAEIEAKKIESVIYNKNIDTVISIALPFVVHMYASMVKKRNHQLKWIPISFDPYAYDEVTNVHCKKECIAEEKKVFKNADKILFPSQFRHDYENNVLMKKIEYYEFPNIRKMEVDLEGEFIKFDSAKINCVFLGNLYLIQRHPQFLFDLFWGMNNKKINLHIIGDLIDIPKEYIENWIEKFDGRLKYTGRVSQKTAINAMLEADILINIGHATTNQCPSKILDYMSTGKPILSVAKIENCTSLPYLKKYPRVLMLSEKDGVSENNIKEVEQFIMKYAYVAPLKYEQISKMFKESTMACMIEKIENC